MNNYCKVAFVLELPFVFSQENGPRTFSFTDDHAVSSVPKNDYLQLPVFDDSLQNDSLMEETDHYNTTTADSEDVFVERNTVDVELDKDIERQQCVKEVQVDSPNSVVKGNVQLCDAVVQTDRYESPEGFSPNKQNFLDLEKDSPSSEQKKSLQLCDLKSDALQPNNDLLVEKIDSAVQCSIFSPVTNTCSQCNILEVENFNGETYVKFDGNDSDPYKFKKVADSVDIGIQVVADEVSFTSKTEKRLSKEETSTEHRKDPESCEGVNSAVQCNIIEILTHEDEILFINEFKTLRFKKLPDLKDIAVQTDVKENNLNAEAANDDFIEHETIDDDVVCNDVIIDHIDNDIVSADAICIGVNVTNIEEDGVREKHDGEPSEKTLRGLGWKDLVDSSELGDDAKVLDCIVYEKEDVFIVICESYRKYCKEISSNDYTFDFDDDSDEFLEICQEKQINDRNDTTSDYTGPGDLDYKMASDGDDRKEDGNVSEATQQIPVSLKTVVEKTVIEKVEIGVQYENQVDDYNATIDQKCPHCLKPLSAFSKIGKHMSDNRNENRFSSEEFDDSMLYSRSNEDENHVGIDTDDKLDLMDELRSDKIEFAFGEMCDVAVQCNLQDSNNFSPKVVKCLCCGHSKNSCNDVAIQCEINNILSSNVHEGLDPFSSDVSCLRCGKSKTSCKDIAVQCEFADLLSSSNGMLDEISEIYGVFQEDEGESLIKEVMALAKECSQNDALIDQHLSEVVRGQDLFNHIQDDEDYVDEEDSDEGEISLSDEQSRDLYSEIPNSGVFPENSQTMLFDFSPNSEKDPNDILEETRDIPWKEVRDVETQCEKNGEFEKEEKAVQCTLLDDGGQFDIERVGEDFPADKVGLML